MPESIRAQFRRAVDEYEARTGCRPTRIVCDPGALSEYIDAISRCARNPVEPYGHLRWEFNGIPIQVEGDLTAAILVEGDAPDDERAHLSARLKLATFVPWFPKGSDQARVNTEHNARVDAVLDALFGRPEKPGPWAPIDPLRPIQAEVNALPSSEPVFGIPPVVQAMIVQHRKALFSDMLARWDAAARRADTGVRHAILDDANVDLGFNWQPTARAVDASEVRIIRRSLHVSDEAPGLWEMVRQVLERVVSQVGVVAWPAELDCEAAALPTGDETYFQWTLRHGRNERVLGVHVVGRFGVVYRPRLSA